MQIKNVKGSLKLEEPQKGNCRDFPLFCGPNEVKIDNGPGTLDREVN